MLFRIGQFNRGSPVKATAGVPTEMVPYQSSSWSSVSLSLPFARFEVSIWGAARVALEGRKAALDLGARARDVGLDGSHVDCAALVCEARGSLTVWALNMVMVQRETDRTYCTELRIDCVQLR
jgi:hypothetical protein